MLHVKNAVTNLVDSEGFNKTVNKLTESNRFTRGSNHKNTFKLHIPMLVSEDVDKVTITKMCQAQQIKILGEIKEMMEDKMDTSILSEDTDLTESTLTPKDVSNAFSYGSKNALDYFNNNESRARTTGIDVDDNAKMSILYTTPYSVIQFVRTKNILFTKTIRVMIKVYAVTLKLEDLRSVFLRPNPKKSFIKEIIPSKIFNAINSGTTILNGGKRLFKSKNNIANTITRTMVMNRTWGSALEKSSYGTSIMISANAVEQLKYQGIDVREPRNIKKLIVGLSLFDMIIADEDTFEILDHTSAEFMTINANELKKSAKSASVKLSME